VRVFLVGNGQGVRALLSIPQKELGVALELVCGGG